MTPFTHKGVVAALGSRPAQCLRVRRRVSAMGHVRSVPIGVASSDTTRASATGTEEWFAGAVARRVLVHERDRERAGDHIAARDAGNLQAPTRPSACWSRRDQALSKRTYYRLPERRRRVARRGPCSRCWGVGGAGPRQGKSSGPRWMQPRARRRPNPGGYPSRTTGQARLPPHLVAAGGAPLAESGTEDDANLGVAIRMYVAGYLGRVDGQSGRRGLGADAVGSHMESSSLRLQDGQRLARQDDHGLSNRPGSGRDHATPAMRLRRTRLGTAASADQVELQDFAMRRVQRRRS